MGLCTSRREDCECGLCSDFTGVVKGGRGRYLGRMMMLIVGGRVQQLPSTRSRWMRDRRRQSVIEAPISPPRYARPVNHPITSP